MVLAFYDRLDAAVINAQGDAGLPDGGECTDQVSLQVILADALQMFDERGHVDARGLEHFSEVNDGGLSPTPQIAHGGEHFFADGRIGDVLGAGLHDPGRHLCIGICANKFSVQIVLTDRIYPSFGLDLVDL